MLYLKVPIKKKKTKPSSIYEDTVKRPRPKTKEKRAESAAGGVFRMKKRAQSLA